MCGIIFDPESSATNSSAVMHMSASFTVVTRTQFQKRKLISVITSPPPCSFQLLDYPDHNCEGGFSFSFQNYFFYCLYVIFSHVYSFDYSYLLPCTFAVRV